MEKELQEFSNEVIEKLDNYVYRLIDPRNGDTFYVGRGKGNRVFNHMNCALSIEESDEVTDKIQTIREIHSAGLKVIHVIHRHGMDQKTAIEVEASLIDAYPGTTNIMGGTGSNDYGPMNAIEIINKYSAEEAVFKHKILMITVNKSILERSIYEATRCAWKLSKTKAEKCELILAVKQGIVVEVFTASKWLPATKENFPELHLDIPNRIGFIGNTAPEKERNLYLRKRIPEKYRKKGASNPIKYSF
mgnify:CR=1 FL=1